MLATRCAACAQAESRHVRELERLKKELVSAKADRDALRGALDGVRGELDEAQNRLKEERRKCVEIELRDLESAEAREAEIEGEAQAKALEAQLRDERARATRAVVAIKLLRGTHERIGRLVFASWARWTKTCRLAAARERAAQLLVAAEEVRITHEARTANMRRELAERDAAVGESIGAMRDEALQRRTHPEALERTREYGPAGRRSLVVVLTGGFPTRTLSCYDLVL